MQVEPVGGVPIEDANWYAGRSIFVTGGSGFIGTNLAIALSRAGAKLVNFDVRPPQLPEHLPYWREGDVCDRKSIQSALAAAEPEVVFNLAAETDIAKGGSAFTANTLGVRVLLDACRGLLRKPLVVHFSTQLTVAPGYQPSNDADLRPYTAYGESKAESEREMHRYGEALEWTIVRPTTVWGPHYPRMASTIWKYLERRWYVAPARPAIRAYGYVDNVVSQVLRLPIVARAEIVGRALYVGDAPMLSTEWLDGFSRALSGKPVRRLPYSLLWLLACGGELSARLGGPSPINFGRLERMSADYPVPMERTFSILGTGGVSYADGVNTTVSWLRSHAAHT